MNAIEQSLFTNVYNYVRIAAEELLEVPKLDVRARAVASRAADAALAEFRKQRDAGPSCPICGSTDSVHDGEKHDAAGG